MSKTCHRRFVFKVAPSGMPRKLAPALGRPHAALRKDCRTRRERARAHADTRQALTGYTLLPGFVYFKQRRHGGHAQMVRALRLDQATAHHVSHTHNAGA